MARRVGLFEKENLPNFQSKELRHESEKLQKRCEDLEKEREAQAQQLRNTDEKLKSVEEQRKVEVERLQRLELVLRGSVAVEQLAGLQKLQEQLHEIKTTTSRQEERLETLANERPEKAEVKRVKDEHGEHGEHAQLKQEIVKLKLQLAQVKQPKPGACCDALFAELRELSATLALLKEQCEALEVENIALKGKVSSLQENLEEVSSSHAELAGHANHRQKIRHTLQLKEDRDQLREENFKLKLRIRQLEASRSSQGIVSAVCDPRGDTKRPRVRQPRFEDTNSERVQQLERQLERNRTNVVHFMALIERAVGREAADAADLLSALRSRFL